MLEEKIDREAAAAGKKRLIVIFCAMLTALLLGLLLYYVNSVKPLEEFRSLYGTGSYEEARTLYENTLSHFPGNARKAENYVSESLYNSWKDYQEGSITREAMESAFESSGSYPALKKAREELEPQLTLLYASRASYEKGLSLLETGDYLSAVDCFAAMSEGDAFYQKGAEKSAEALASYAGQIKEQTDRMMRESQYEEAMTTVSEALSRFPEEDSLLQQKETIYSAYREYRRQTSVKEARAFLDQGDLEDALEILVTLEKDFPDDAEITSLTDQYAAAYCEQAASEAAPYLDNGQYQEALDVIRTAYDLFPENETIASIYDRVDGHLPVQIDSLTWENISLRGTKTISDNVTDTHGNTYGHAVVYTEPSAISMQTMTYTEGKEQCSLNARYTRLQGKLAIKGDSRGIRNDRTGTFRIYGDDTILLEATGLSETSEPVSFDLDVSRVETLTFSFESGTGLKYMLGDTVIYRYFDGCGVTTP